MIDEDKKQEEVVEPPKGEKRRKKDREVIVQRVSAPYRRAGVLYAKVSATDKVKWMPVDKSLKDEYKIKYDVFLELEDV